MQNIQIQNEVQETTFYLGFPSLAMFLKRNLLRIQSLVIIFIFYTTKRITKKTELPVSVPLNLEILSLLKTSPQKIYQFPTAIFSTKNMCSILRNNIRAPQRVSLISESVGSKLNELSAAESELFERSTRGASQK